VFVAKTRKHETPRFFAVSHRLLLRFAAEGAAVGSGVQRLAAVPAEARLRRFARLQPEMDVLGDAVPDERLRRLLRRRSRHRIRS